MQLQKPLLVKFEDGRNAIGKGKTYFHGIIKSGEIETVLIGRSRMIVWASLEAYVERLRQQSQSAKAA